MRSVARYRRVIAGVAGAAGAAAAGAGGYALVVRGQLTLDAGWGRSTLALGPQQVEIAAPRAVVYDVISAPYLGRTPKVMEHKLEVVERGTDMVLAAHRTPAVAGLVATTLETVRFEPPGRVAFRLVRGPVPCVEETFELTESSAGTHLDYRGELGVDFFFLGRLWGRAVARHWEAAVAGSLETIRAEAERRAAHGSTPRA